MGSAVGDFTVTVTATELVTAAGNPPRQVHWLPLSNLDLLLPPLDVGIFFCYDNNAEWTFSERANALKSALAEALVPFYALAGEVVENALGEPEIVCNNRGVEFSEAEGVDVALRDLRLYDPDGCVEGKLVPKKINGVLSVQVTELKCGGTVVGLTFDHRVADAYSVNMFLVAWAQIATFTTTTATPSFRRSLLNPRHPLSFDSSPDQLYVPFSSLPPPPPTATTPPMISRIYTLSAAQLSALQSRATNHKTRSKLEAFSAFLWKIIAQHAMQYHDEDVALDENSGSVKIGVVVDGRKHLGPAMSSYFGNVLSIPYARVGVRELCEMDLADVAEVVGRFLAGFVTREHFLGLVDWVEAHRPEPAVARVYTEATKEGPAFVVSSGQRFPVREVDFGWGGPVFGSYHFPWGGSTGYVMPLPSPKGNGDWIVYMHLWESQLDFIEEKASHVFRPFAFDCVKKLY